MDKQLFGKYTMLIKGTKQHDISSMIEEICASSCVVILIDCGELCYKSSHHMGNSIKTVFKRRGIDVSTITIVGNNRQILLFKN